MSFYIAWADAPGGPSPGKTIEYFTANGSGTQYPPMCTLGLGEGANLLIYPLWEPVTPGVESPDGYYTPPFDSNVWSYGLFDINGFNYEGYLMYLYISVGYNGDGRLTYTAVVDGIEAENKLYIDVSDGRLFYYSNYVAAGPTVLTPWWEGYSGTFETL